MSDACEKCGANFEAILEWQEGKAARDRELEALRGELERTKVARNAAEAKLAEVERERDRLRVEYRAIAGLPDADGSLCCRCQQQPRVKSRDLCPACLALHIDELATEKSAAESREKALLRLVVDLSDEKRRAVEAAEAKLADLQEQVAHRHLDACPLAQRAVQDATESLRTKLAEVERERDRLTARVCDLQREVHNKDVAGRRVLDHVRSLLAEPAAEAREKALLRLVVDLSELIGNCPRCHAAMHPSDVGREAGLGTHLAGCELGAALAAGREGP